MRPPLFGVLSKDRSLPIPLQKADLVFERLSLFHELGDHCVFPWRKWATSAFACLKHVVRQLEKRNTLPLFLGD